MEYYDIIIKSKDKEEEKNVSLNNSNMKLYICTELFIYIKLQNMLFGKRWEQKEKLLKFHLVIFRFSFLPCLVENGEREKFKNMLKAALVIHKQQQFFNENRFKSRTWRHKSCKLISSYFMTSSREINFLRCCRHLKDFGKIFSSLRFLFS